VAVSEGFKQRVKELLLRIRSEVFRPGRPKVRVVLTGRPSDAVDECTEFFRDETAVLTVRTLHPNQLPLYAQLLRRATEQKLLSYEGVSYWTFPPENSLKPIFDRYTEAFGKQRIVRNHLENRNRQTGVAAVLGYPLLLHFTFRLLSETDVDRKELIESPTALLRRLTDYATVGADLPSDRQQGAKIQARLSGSDLRVLLRRTAAHMTILGQESIAKAELEKRLRTADLVGQVKEISKDKVISALLVSFYFKGGNAALGCEFTHKAFREYLFAEEVVETLKAFVRTMPDDLPERPPSRYWKDYDEADPRRKCAAEFATLLAPQWLLPEVVSYLGSLVEWETGRTFSTQEMSDSAGATSPLTPGEWQRARVLLADLWDWWADGVHLRPQPHDDDYTGQIKWDASLAERLVPRCRPLTALVSGDLPEPVRTTTLDAHLGDALFRLASRVHWHLQAFEPVAHLTSRRYQRLDGAKVMFRPTGTNASYFGVLCHRISAAGWRPDGEFPNGVDARGTDFARTTMNSLCFNDADLEASSFQKASVMSCQFSNASLASCNFSGGTIAESDFLLARLDSANFLQSSLYANRFNGASLIGASFQNVKWGDSTFFGSVLERSVPVPPNDFSDAVGIDQSVREQASSVRGSEPSSAAKPGQKGRTR
jgi:Pentapeptide repeats (9 copies)